MGTDNTALLEKQRLFMPGLKSRFHKLDRVIDEDDRVRDVGKRLILKTSRTLADDHEPRSSIHVAIARNRLHRTTSISDDDFSRPE